MKKIIITELRKDDPFKIHAAKYLENKEFEILGNVYCSLINKKDIEELEKAGFINLFSFLDGYKFKEL